jgi:uncharacterized OB-fold protein
MNMTLPTLAEPLQSPENAKFWQACAEQKLLLKHCADCDKLHYYPRSICPWCLSANTHWQQVCGAGEIYSFTDLQNDSGHYPAYIQLAEGPVILSLLVSDGREAVAIGKTVQLSFAKTAAGTAISIFNLVPQK